MMIVQLDRLADFITEITREAANIEGKIVRLRTIEQQENEACVSHGVVLTAIVVDDEGNGHLLRMAKDCGFDVNGRTEGADQIGALTEDLDAACGSLGLHVRAGEIEL